MTEQLTREQYLALSAAERKKARAAGLCNQLMGKPVDDDPITEQLRTVAEYAALTPERRRQARRDGYTHLIEGVSE